MTEQTHVVAPGETLSAIAQKYYGDGTEPSWQLIYEANKETIGDDPNVITPGEELVIPPKPEHQAQAQSQPGPRPNQPPPTPPRRS